MTRTKDKVTDVTDNVKPYVERALHDAELRQNIRNAYDSARSIYDELLGQRGLTGVATRVVKDRDMQDELRNAINELRSAADRVQGNAQRKGHSGLLFVLAVVTALVNPITGPKLRKWISNRIFGGDDDFTYQGGNGSSGTGS
jgi:hypothetical protein